MLLKVFAIVSCILVVSASRRPSVIKSLKRKNKVNLPLNEDSWNQVVTHMNDALDGAMVAPKDLYTKTIQEPAHTQFLKLYKQMNNMTEGTGRKLMSHDEIVLNNSTMEDTLRMLSKLPNMDIDDVTVDEEELSTFSRKLQQGVNIAGTNVPIGGYANAFTLLFSNLFDLALSDGAYALVPIIADVIGVAQNWNWIGDLTSWLDAPFDNIVNTLYFPLPQNDADFHELVKRFTKDYCIEEEATPSSFYLGQIEGPTFSVELSPWECPIVKDKETHEKKIDWENCSEAELTIALSKTTHTEHFKSAVAYSGAECKFEHNFGTALSLAIGGGDQIFSLRFSEQGVDLIPVINQFNIPARFGPYVPPPFTETIGNRTLFNATMEGQITPTNNSILSQINDLSLADARPGQQVVGNSQRGNGPRVPLPPTPSPSQG